MRTTLRGLRRLLYERSLEKNVDIHLRSTDPLAREIEPDVVDMVAKSYAPIGGNPKVRKVGDASAEYADWVVADIDDDPEADVFIGANRRQGMKIGVSATDGTPAAKAYMNALRRKLMQNGWWSEMSGAPAHIALNKLGIAPIEDEAKVRQLLGDKKITWHGEHPDGKFPGTYGWYTREIGGVPHVKIIVGDV